MPAPAIVMLTLLGLLLAVIVLVVVRTTAARRRVIREFVGRHGLVHERKASKAFRRAWAVLPELPDKGNVTNLIYGALGPADITIFEHTHMVMAGNTPIAIVHTVAAAEIDPLTPEVHLVRRSFMKSIAASFSAGRTTIDVGDEAFRKEWVVSADDLEFARALLTPEVCDLLRGRKHDRGWHIIGGKVAGVQRRQLGRETLADLPERLSFLTDHIHTIAHAHIAPEQEFSHEP